MADEAGAQDQYQHEAEEQLEDQEAGAGKKRERDGSADGSEPEAKRANALVSGDWHGDTL